MRVAVRSDMGAVVLETPLGAGAEVEEGEALLVLEAMKMEMPVPAPRRGVIAQVHVAVGDVVTEDQVLVTLEC